MKPALLPCLVLLPMTMQAQSFQNNYGAGRYEEGVAVVNDGTALVSVVRHYREGYGHGLQLLRTSLTGGSPVMIDVALPGAVFAQSAVLAEGGDIVVCGSIIPTGRYDQDALLLRITGAGTPVWTWTSDDAQSNEEFLCIDVLEDGWAVGGQWRQGGNSDALLARFDGNGAPIWQQHYDAPHDERATGITHDAGGLVAVGSNTFPLIGGTTGHDAFALRTGLDGVQQWQMVLGGGGDDHAAEVITRTDGSFVWAGHTRSWPLGDTTNTGERPAHAWLVAFNLFGDTLWTRTYGDITAHRRTWTLEQDPNTADILLAGEYATGHRSNAFVIRTDPSGEMIWERTYDLQRTDRLRGLTFMPDNGFAGTGKCTGPQGGQVLLLRKNADGL